MDRQGCGTKRGRVFLCACRRQQRRLICIIKVGHGILCYILPFLLDRRNTVSKRLCCEKIKAVRISGLLGMSTRLQSDLLRMFHPPFLSPDSHASPRIQPQSSCAVRATCGRTLIKVGLAEIVLVFVLQAMRFHQCTGWGRLLLSRPADSRSLDSRSDLIQRDK